MKAKTSAVKAQKKVQNKEQQSPEKKIIAHKAISVRGAKVHNLNDVSVDIPRNALTVITGVSGSGKSSLAFDTIYAEGQRRFVESLSAYARQFLERMHKPEVETISGIPPAIAIEQKTVTRNPRSTVGTSTEIYDYLRLLYGRIGTTLCADCGGIVRKDTPQSVLEAVREWGQESRLYIMFPLRKHENRSIAEELENMKLQGYYRLVVGSSTDIVDISADTLPNGIHANDLTILADRLIFRDAPEDRTRISESVESAFRHGDGRCIIRNISTGEDKHFSNLYECASCQVHYEEPEPRLFSFNNPVGACPTCQGFGRTTGIDPDLVIPDIYLSIRAGAIVAFKHEVFSKYKDIFLHAAKIYNFPLQKAYADLTPEEKSFIWNGHGEFAGLLAYFDMLEKHASTSMQVRIMLSRFRGYTTCRDCKGSRLKLSARQVFVGGKNLAQVTSMSIDEAVNFFQGMELTPFQTQVAGRVIHEITSRLKLLNEIGLSYLTLDRLSHTLSGGEMQRINLATSIGSSLVGTLYVLDEPSIGLHPRDTERMITILRRLRNLGNTVIVVEHDEDIIRSADWVIDMGPRAGEHGGKVVFSGTVPALLESKKSLTGKYISGELQVHTTATRFPGNGKFLTIIKPRENNLRFDKLKIPLGCCTVFTGVSGSGKSSLIHDVLYKNMLRQRGQSVSSVGKVEEIQGTEHISHIEMIDQSPISTSSRSTPATYTGSFDYIRELFAGTHDAKRLNWRPGYFSFNVPGGRCDACEGEGQTRVEMQFMADIFLPCEVCNGTRFKAEAKEILYRGKNIMQVLDMTITEAIEFFAKEKRVINRLQPLHDVGLGYMRLGQPGHTLSGGEAQRIKLASHLAYSDHEQMLFIFDEPTTGLHFEDISKLLLAFRKLVERGHSLIIIEHNPDVILSADWIIDLGPEGGVGGGLVVAEGTPKQIAEVEGSHTGAYLRRLFSRD